MKNLRIKISLGSFNVEIEGESEDVIAQLEEMKKNGLGQMVDQLIPIYSKTMPNDSGDNLKTALPSLLEGRVDDKQHQMTLYDLALKMLPKSETEWILIYGYYSCDGQKSNFTREDLIKKYDESNRKKLSNIKNLSASIKGAAKNGWISQQNDTDFIVTPEGTKKVVEILDRTESTTKAPRALKKKKSEVNLIVAKEGGNNA